MSDIEHRIAEGWHDKTCAEGAECRSRDLHAASMKYDVVVQYMVEIVTPLAEQARQDYENEISLLLPPDVDGDESQDYLIRRWIERAALVMGDRDGYTDEHQEAITQVREGMLEGWLDANDEALLRTVQPMMDAHRKAGLETYADALKARFGSGKYTNQAAQKRVVTEVLRAQS